MDFNDIKELKQQEEIVEKQQEVDRKKIEKKRAREQLKAQRSKEKKVRNEIRQQNTCQGTCAKYSNKNNSWFVCDYCETFTMCPKCFKSQKVIMDEHEEICGDATKK